MKMFGSPRRIVFVALASLTLSAAVFGSAATLGGISARGLGGGQSSVQSCDSDGVGVTYTTSAGTVTSVTITGVAAGCANGAMYVVLTNGSNASIGASGPVTVSGTSVVMPLAPQPSAASVAAAHVSITGP